MEVEDYSALLRSGKSSTRTLKVGRTSQSGHARVFCSIMVLALILIFVLILFLVALITSALSAPGEESNKTVSARKFPARPHRRGIGVHRPASAPAELPESFVPHRQTDRGLTEAKLHFTAARRTKFEPTDELTTSYEGFFTSNNRRFTVGGRNDGGGGICFLTGQPKSACQCGECVNRRDR